MEDEIRTIKLRLEISQRKKNKKKKHRKKEEKKG